MSKNLTKVLKYVSMTTESRNINMSEIFPTNFAHDIERHDTDVSAEAAYTLFEPVVEHIKPDGTAETLNRNVTLEQMKEYATRLDVRPPYTIPLGGGEYHSVGEVIDTRASNLLREVNEMTPAPEAMTGILTTVAELAERSGFDRDKARFSASFMYPAADANPNLNIHSDGLSGLVEQDTKKARATRFVYALGPGSLLCPNIDEPGVPVDTDTGSVTVPIESPTPLQIINSPRGAEFTEEDLLAGGAQQVLPGVILGFDPTRTFWHQAHEAPRPILTIDVQQAE